MNIYMDIFFTLFFISSLLPPSVQRHYEKLHAWLQPRVVLQRSIKRCIWILKRVQQKNVFFKKVTFHMNFLKCVWRPSLALITETPSKRLSHSFIMATELHYFPADWWSLPPNKQLPYYLSELHPLPFFLPLRANPSLHSPVPHPVPWGFPPPPSAATASINHSHLLTVQLLDLLTGGKPVLKWCIADFYAFLVCFE